MPNSPNTQDSTKQETVTRPATANQRQISPPAITLPKGGGAIRGIGEKFAANPVTGTGSMTVPIATSPGRSGFGPQLSLSYDSGAGNGPFGFGWSLSVPNITRKTDKGLPRYWDDEESDEFILSGAEDLVPVYRQDAKGNFVRDNGKLVIHEDPRGDYTVRHYRPRIEGLFARIERWRNDITGEIYWRAITKDNITSIYGDTPASRIFDPTDNKHVFSWLLARSYDDKGNVIVYEYAAENDQNVPAALYECNRQVTANRYLKRISYGHQTPYDPAKNAPDDWHFQVVFDYGEHDAANPQVDDDTGHTWPCRPDSFSSFRVGFEIRTYRRCKRVLMFHRFAELGAKPCLVRSTDFSYLEDEQPQPIKSLVASFITTVTQSGYIRQGGGYLKRSLPPVEFTYSEVKVDETVHTVDATSLENLPSGLDGSRYQWVDLDGEGLSGILTEQGEAWFYKRNLSPIITEKNEQNQPHVVAGFAPLEMVRSHASLADLAGGRQQFLDLAGDGQVDLMQLDGPAPGFYERTADGGWEMFRPFTSLPNVPWHDPNLKFVDLTGDGHADVLISEDEVFTWYPSLAEAGFGPATYVRQPSDEEMGPRLVFADGTQSIYLADMSGDGLTDLVRLRNGEVCYWPNLGYGHFGAKVTMDNAPWFDTPDQFNQQRIRVADIDGSGNTDIIYLGRDSVRLYFNRSGNSWSPPHPLTTFPAVDNLASIMALDLLGNGTACLVWSSPLPGNGRQPMRYIELMGEGKPHLLVTVINNLGAETHIQYAPSTRFYLADKQAGQPWITRLPFPVHVVERVETHDHISRNRFVTRYAYHHGYFDGEEREFRGFGRVDQWDTEEFAALSTSGDFPAATNLDAASHVPPVLTKTWFHTGAYIEGGRISRQFETEYYREGDPSLGEAGLSTEQMEALLLEDTVLPAELSAEEQREACRSLKGSILRQEIYALDDTEESDRPYSVSERNYTIKRVQPVETNKHAVFFTHPCETIDFHYERKLVEINGKQRADPRASHTLTLKVDEYGNVERSIAIGYRRRDIPGLQDPEQTDTHLTLTVNRFANHAGEQDWYRVGLPIEMRTYEVVKPLKPKVSEGLVALFKFEAIHAQIEALFPSNQIEPSPAQTWPYEKWDWRRNAINAPAETRLRLIEHVRTIYRRNDLTGLLPLNEVQSLALPGESYKLAFTPNLLKTIYMDSGKLPAGDEVKVFQTDGGHVHSEGDANWWIPSGRVFYHEKSTATPDQERDAARQHFFLPRRFVDPFGNATTIKYDKHDLLVIKTTDAVENVVAATNDYRVLQPRLVTGPNGNRSEDAFDALGMVVGTAMMGKSTEVIGDSLAGFEVDLKLTDIQQFVANPRNYAQGLLKNATTRVIYDLDRFQRCGQPPFAATLAREIHSQPNSAQSPIQLSFIYSDGFGREVETKIQAEPGDAPKRDPETVTTPSGDIMPGPLVIENGEPKPGHADHRWVGKGRTVYNNKGKPVKQYEPFFSSTHLYEEEPEMTDTGVTPILFYDPAERVVATLHPNHTWEKVVFDPWQQATWDVNDTVLLDPKTDEEVKDFFLRLPEADYWPTWHAQRIAGNFGATPVQQLAEKQAAEKTAKHAGTPTVAYLDTLGRTFLTFADNGPDPAQPAKHLLFATRIVFDIEGNQREVIDAKGRVVMRYDYDIAGPDKDEKAGSNWIHQASMEAGERWILNDVTGKPIRTWDSRRHEFVYKYDALRRPLETRVMGGDGPAPLDNVFEKIIYGENQLLNGKKDTELNLRGKPFAHYDTAGKVQFEAYDFKANLQQSHRRLAEKYKQIVQWDIADPDSAVEHKAYPTETEYDALNRVTMSKTPDGSVTRPVYNEANLLNSIKVRLRGANNLETFFVTNIDYNAKGQRVRIEYGNGASTAYDYDKATFRLIHLKTTRPAGLNGLAPQLFVDPATVQDLRYTYDPVGNITNITDRAIPAIIHNNQHVEPVSNYVYDAIYRLISAEGREHIGQTAFDFNPPDGSYRDYPFVGSRAHPNDPKAVRNYTETYDYDEVGNIEKIQHVATAGSWTRRYTYNEDSLLAPPHTNIYSNRLTSTQIGNGPPELYTHDIHGNMTQMPHLPVMAWNFKDELQATSQQDVKQSGCTPETTYYVYGADGQRVRKVTERHAPPECTPSRREERIYLGGFEIYRRYEADGSTPRLERETLHIMDDKQRIALVETRTQGLAPAPQQLIRYQFGNHLGSASLELDDQAQIISYEEYYPYGSTSYQAVCSQTETPKRYRYTGKERDEESGLYYHGARYYAPWLGRWISSDPLGVQDNYNLYTYVKDKPVISSDPSGTQAEIVGTVKNMVEGLKTLRSNLRAPVEYGLAQNERTGGFVILKGGTGSVPPPAGYNVIAHTHVGQCAGPSDPDIRYVAEKKLKFHLVFSANKETPVSRLSYNSSTGRVTVQYYTQDKFGNSQLKTTRVFHPANWAYDEGGHVLRNPKTGEPILKPLASQYHMKITPGDPRAVPRTAFGSFVSSVRTKLSGASQAIRGAVKQVAKSLIPGSEFYDYLKLIGGGSLMQGARILISLPAIKVVGTLVAVPAGIVAGSAANLVMERERFKTLLPASEKLRKEGHELGGFLLIQPPHLVSY